jgi:hypothetical protein
VVMSGYFRLIRGSNVYSRLFQVRLDYIRLDQFRPF